MNGTFGAIRAYRWGFLAAITGIVLCVSTLTVAQTTAPARRDAIEQQSIRPRATTQSAGASRAAAQPPKWMDVPRVLAALGVVIGLIFFLRWLGKKYVPSLAGGRAAGVVRVLSRAPVSPKQQVLLVQVGRRVLVVADNGTQMSALSEITDADEVASLLGQLSAKPEPETREFDETLDQAKQDFEPAATRLPLTESAERESDQAESNLEPASTEIEGLMQKVRTLAKQLGRS